MQGKEVLLEEEDEELSDCCSVASVALVVGQEVEGGVTLVGLQLEIREEV
jgi:hypothetical protein